jgi:hypothetical protein
VGQFANPYYEQFTFKAVSECNFDAFLGLGRKLNIAVSPLPCPDMECPDN